MNSSDQTLAVDLGGTNIKLAAVGRTGKLTGFTELPADSERGIEEALKGVEQAVSNLAERESGFGFSRAGFSFPGFLDPETGRITKAFGKYPGAEGFDFDRWSRNKLGVPAIAENDANAALLGELAFGAAVGERNAALMILGTGIGTAAVCESRLIRGVSGRAGIMGGHLVLEPGGRRCTCGGFGCAEAYAGSWALPKIARERPGFETSLLAKEPAVDYESLMRLSESDEFCAELLGESISVWAAVALALVSAYDPRVLVLSGGVSRGHSYFLEKMKKKVCDTLAPDRRNFEFRVSERPGSSVLLGLSALSSDR